MVCVHAPKYVIIHIYTHIHTYVQMCTHIYVYIQICEYACINLCTGTKEANQYYKVREQQRFPHQCKHIHIFCVHIQKYTYKCINTHIYIYIYTHINPHYHVNTYVYICINIYVYTYIYTEVNGDTQESNHDDKARK